MPPRLEPLPERGAVPSVVNRREAMTELELKRRARLRNYEGQIRKIARRHFGRMRVASIRAEGFEQLREFTDPAAFRPMIEVLQDEADDVRLAMLDHFAAEGDEGQAALARVAIHQTDDEDAGLRHEATRRMVMPAAMPVIRELDLAPAQQPARGGR